jgi:DNA polymerase III gamma/tau subunit
VVTFGGDRVDAPEIAKILGVTDRRALLAALAALVHREGPALLELIDDLYNQGHDLKRFYQDLVHYARHLLLAGLHPEARRLAEVADSEWEELIRLSRGRPAEHLHNLLSVLLLGEEELRRAPQPRLALEVLLLRLLHLEPLTPVDAWLKRLESLEKRLGAASPATPAFIPEASSGGKIRPRPLPPLPGKRPPCRLKIWGKPGRPSWPFSSRKRAALSMPNFPGRISWQSGTRPW